MGYKKSTDLTRVSSSCLLLITYLYAKPARTTTERLETSSPPHVTITHRPRGAKRQGSPFKETPREDAYRAISRHRCRCCCYTIGQDKGGVKGETSCMCGR